MSGVIFVHIGVLLWVIWGCWT